MAALQRTNEVQEKGNNADSIFATRGLLVFLPTFNERGNVAEVVHRIKAVGIAADVLFIDDNSPDGTGAVLDDLARQQEGIVVFHRQGRQGIGSAHKEAARFAYQQGYNRLITMDADLTHPPEAIPALLDCTADADMVIASRFLPGGFDRRRWRSKYVSQLSHWLTRLLLKLPYDVTNAYRLYHLDRIDPALFAQVQSDDYAFFVESIVVLRQNGVRIKEVPALLAERGAGASKKRFRDVPAWLRQLILLGFRALGVSHDGNRG